MRAFLENIISASYTFNVRKDFFQKKLKDLLLEESLLTSAQIKEVEVLAGIQKKNFIDVLMSQNLVSEESLLMCFSKNGELPFLYLSQYACDEEALRIWGLDFCRQHHCAAFDLREQEIWVATFNPLDPELISKMKQQDKHINLYLTSYSEIGKALAVISPDPAHFNAAAPKQKAA